MPINYNFFVVPFTFMIVLDFAFSICICPGIIFPLFGHHHQYAAPTRNRVKSREELIDEEASFSGTASKGTNTEHSDTLWVVPLIVWILMFLILVALIIWVMVSMINWGRTTEQHTTQMKAFLNLWLRYLRPACWLRLAFIWIVLVGVGYGAEIITQFDGVLYKTYHSFLYGPFVLYLTYVFQTNPMQDFAVLVLLPAADLADSANLVSILSLNSWKAVRISGTIGPFWLTFLDTTILVVWACYMVIPALSMVRQAYTTIGKKDLIHWARPAYFCITVVLNIIAFGVRVYLMHGNMDAYLGIGKNSVVISGIIIHAICSYCPDRLKEALIIEVTVRDKAPLSRSITPAPQDNNATLNPTFNPKDNSTEDQTLANPAT